MTDETWNAVLLAASTFLLIILTEIRRRQTKAASILAETAKPTGDDCNMDIKQVALILGKLNALEELIPKVATDPSLASDLLTAALELRPLVDSVPFLPVSEKAKFVLQQILFVDPTADKTGNDVTFEPSVPGRPLPPESP